MRPIDGGPQPGRQRNGTTRLPVEGVATAQLAQTTASGARCRSLPSVPAGGRLRWRHCRASCKGLIVRCVGGELNTKQPSGIPVDRKVVSDRLARVLVTPTDKDTPVPSKQPPDNAAPTTLRRLRVNPDGLAVAQNLASEYVVHHVSHGPAPASSPSGDRSAPRPNPAAN